MNQSCGGPGSATCAHPGGATVGPTDTHCVSQAPQEVSAAACNASVVATDLNDAMGSSAGTSDYAATMYGVEGNDDDCKYHVVWHASTICRASNVTFFATVTHLTDGSVVTGATPRLEVFLNDTHPAPNSNQAPVETAPGTYSVGPVAFDLPGQWTVRWHFFETCDDSSPASPHGHAAFFVTVP